MILVFDSPFFRVANQWKVLSRSFALFSGLFVRIPYPDLRKVGGGDGRGFLME